MLHAISQWFPRDWVITTPCRSCVTEMPSVGFLPFPLPTFGVLLLPLTPPPKYNFLPLHYYLRNCPWGTQSKRGTNSVKTSVFCNFGDLVEHPDIPPWVGVHPMRYLNPAFEETELSTAYTFSSLPLMSSYTCWLVRHTEQLPKEGRVPWGLIFPRQRRLNSPLFAMRPNATFLTEDSPRFPSGFHIRGILLRCLCSHHQSQNRASGMYIRSCHSVVKWSCQLNLAEAPLDPRIELLSFTRVSKAVWRLDS